MNRGKYFLIISKMNRKCMDVEGGHGTAGTRIIMYDRHGNDNQQFYADPATGTIRSKVGGLCLDAQGDGIVLSAYNAGDPTQQWELFEDRIRNRQDNNKVFDIAGRNGDNGAKILSYNFHGEDNQLWQFEYIEPRYFHVQSLMHSKVLDVEGANSAPNTKVVVYGKHSGNVDNQLFYEGPFGTIRSKLNDFVLDTSSGELRLQPYNAGNKDQMWFYDGQTKVIRNARDHNTVLDIAGNDESNCATVLPYNFHGQPNQLWELSYI